VAEHIAQAYADKGTPEEQSRRTFLANATLAVGGVIGLVLTVPLVGSLIPQSLAEPDKAGGKVWADLPADGFKSIGTKPGTPVNIKFDFQYADGYFPPADDDQSVWGVQLTPAQADSFKAKRPDLFAAGPSAAIVGYDAINKMPSSSVAFVLFSPICPHLGCRFDWSGDANRFICPCLVSQLGPEGAKLAGPAPRGLDPLPFRDTDGKAQVTWIQYKSGTPDRVIVAYS
jgi:menaquinol-cytochrome c reductase iron-sulfur subunit